MTNPSAIAPAGGERASALAGAITDGLARYGEIFTSTASARPALPAVGAANAVRSLLAPGLAELKLRFGRLVPQGGVWV